MWQYANMFSLEKAMTFFVNRINNCLSSRIIPFITCSESVTTPLAGFRNTFIYNIARSYLSSISSKRLPSHPIHTIYENKTCHHYFDCNKNFIYEWYGDAKVWIENNTIKLFGINVIRFSEFLLIIIIQDSIIWLHNYSFGLLWF